MKNKLSSLLAITLVSLLLFSCNKDKKGEITFHSKISSGSEVIQPSSGVYQNSQQSLQYKIENFDYYVDHVDLINDADETESINDVMLFKTTLNESLNDYTYEIPATHYKKMTVYFGLNAATNATDPSEYDADSPLGSYKAMYWGMATRYVFLKIEGKADTSSIFNIPFAYHCGNDAFYKSKTFDIDLNVTDGGNSTINLTSDVNALFNRAADMIDMSTDNQTHTMDNMPLASRTMINFVETMQIEN